MGLRLTTGVGSGISLSSRSSAMSRCGSVLSLNSSLASVANMTCMPALYAVSTIRRTPNVLPVCVCPLIAKCVRRMSIGLVCLSRLPVRLCRILPMGRLRLW